MKHALAGVLCLTLLALPAHAVSPIDGKWQTHFPHPQGGQIAVIFDFSTNGNIVAGTVSSWVGSGETHKVNVQDGKVQGNTVTFAIFYPLPFLSNRFGFRELFGLWRNWGAPTNALTGSVTKDSVFFTEHDWNGDTVQFQATRVK
jgi:hypothetical protein